VNWALGRTELLHLRRGRSAAELRPRRGIGIGVISRLRCSSLDRALAVGEDPLCSPLLFRRSIQLTGQRNRRRLAAGIEALLEAAEDPPLMPGSAIRPRRKEVLAARPLMLRAAEILRSPEPIQARGVAQMGRLLSDPTGSVYSPAPAMTLSDELGCAISAMGGPLPSK
jgi:hypothetical protein